MVRHYPLLPQLRMRKAREGGREVGLVGRVPGSAIVCTN
jgi:hypothetical protein